MLTILVKEAEQESRDTKEVKTLREENEILKEVVRQHIEKGIDYKDLLEEGLELLDKQQEEIEKISLRANLWVDEVVRNYNAIGDLGKAMELTGHEIMIYELNRIRKKCVEEE